MGKVVEKVWKPILHRIVTGQWQRFMMRNEHAPFPQKMKNPGLYLHVPFCRELCPYCPYNREKYDKLKYKIYEEAIYKEIDLYAKNIPKQEYYSLYIGGGTPTIEPKVLKNIINYIKKSFSFSGDICIELHPSEMDEDCLLSLKEVGTTMISIGVETTDDSLLQLIGRKHNGLTAIEAIKRAVSIGFDSINVDLMFALPTQTLNQLDKDIKVVIDAGTDQISTYPIFGFPYTELGENLKLTSIKRPAEKLIKRMFNLITRRAKEEGMERCAVWSFLKPKKKKFSSITRHHYIGFGPSAASMTGDYFCVNTFSLTEYARALQTKRRPITLSMRMKKQHEMAYWLYWRVYEMDIKKDEFTDYFGENLKDIYGVLLFLLKILGMVSENKNSFVINESASYLIHRIQNEYSLNYINRLWGLCRKTAWPKWMKL